MEFKHQLAPPTSADDDYAGVSGSDSNSSRRSEATAATTVRDNDLENEKIPYIDVNIKGDSYETVRSSDKSQSKGFKEPREMNSMIKGVDPANVSSSELAIGVSHQHRSKPRNVNGKHGEEIFNTDSSMTFKGLEQWLQKLFDDADEKHEKAEEDKDDTENSLWLKLRAIGSLKSKAGLLAYIDELEETIVSLKETCNKPESSAQPGSIASEDVDDLAEAMDLWKLEVKRWKEMPDKFGDPVRHDDEAGLEAFLEHNTSVGGYVLDSSRVYDRKMRHTGTKLEIRSPLLIGILKRVIQPYPRDDYDLLFAADVIIQEPYIMIFHNLRKLEQEFEKLEGDEKKHLRVLLDFLRKEWPTACETLDLLEARDAKEIAYKFIWLLYPPGTIVYAHTDGEWEAFRVSRLRGFKQLSAVSFGGLTVHCEYARFDDTGTKLARGSEAFYLESFAGNRPIQSCRLIPEAHMSEPVAVRQSLIERGQKFLNFKDKAHFQEYTGDAWLTTAQNDGSRVMIDYFTSSKGPSSTYDRNVHDHRYTDEASPQWENESHRSSDRSRIADHGQMADLDQLADFDQTERLLCCPATISAYSLRDKSWKSVKVSELQEVSFREDAFKQLVIEKNHKIFVKAMVRSYLSKDPSFKDLIKGKGRGLVVLLHGAPGTGKTLTAECVAEKENRPLYMVTCGDLGTEPDQLEKKLAETFEYAVNWDAVLLLDEADVFLQERDIHDLKRNALVSVFLRQLEYFDGVLFLTTNRPGSFDEAFQSRIHMALGLPELDDTAQLKVWGIFIKELQIDKTEKERILKFVSEEIKKKNTLNGRQIRNAVRTAIAIAMQKNQPVAKKHISDVLGIGRDFTDYLARVNRANQEARAAAMGHRVSIKTAEKGSD